MSSQIGRREFLTGVAAGGLVGLAGCAGAPAPGRPEDPYDIWNLHCHLYGIPGTTPADRVGYALSAAARLGIGRLIFYMGMVPGSTFPTAEDIRRFNDECLEGIRPWHPRALGFVYVNPAHVEPCLAEVDRCVRQGPMVGVKLHVAKHCNAPELDPLARRAGELQVPIYQHTWLKVDGNSPGESTPFDLVELAARHPGTQFICGHAGGDWERGIRAIRRSKNVALELAGFDPTAGVAEMAVRELGADRIVYGSDTGGRSFASQVSKVLGADLSEAAKRLILGGNLKRLLTPILRAKGFLA
ncbi:MAG TPA: amidohydrolase family protein [Planctomycetota bacterium]|nr:amidohydrolase family protein [Planctomycetota bacterium]